jgi:hypothetical protein
LSRLLLRQGFFMPGLAWTMILVFVLPHTARITGLCQNAQKLKTLILKIKT